MNIAIAVLVAINMLLCWHVYQLGKHILELGRCIKQLYGDAAEYNDTMDLIRAKQQQRESEP